MDPHFITSVSATQKGITFSMNLFKRQLHMSKGYAFLVL
jgi:hypothetical protein